MRDVIILGCGMVGSAIAMDLAADPGLRVTVADVRAEPLAEVARRFGVRTLQADLLSDPGALARTVAPFDVVVGALPSQFGLPVLRTIIEAGKNYVDISFMPEDPLALAPLARERGVVAVVDCGVAPGSSNVILGWATSVLDACEAIHVKVGGLPAIRTWPYAYKAPFAPSDVIEEYTRPARMVEHGEVVVYEALSGAELVDVPGIGTLEVFNTDGLRTLISTMNVPHMTEKTMRWPGHIELMRVLRDTGFFAKEPIVVGGREVVPLDVTSALLFPKWTFEPGEEDITVLRVEAVGKKDGQRVRMVWDMIDRYDASTGTRSMSRTTGFPAAIMTRWLAESRVKEPGVHPPEVIGRIPGLCDEMLAELRKRGIDFRARVETLPST
jgi:saccharopine dehydrogenase-like NADP-dependent oxidoreductase